MEIGVAPAMFTTYFGKGLFAGLPPDPGVPDSPDGRFRVANVPSRGKVMVYNRDNMAVVASTLSGEDGTWRIDYLNPALTFVVIGWDDTGVSNAAIQDWVKPAPME